MYYHIGRCMAPCCKQVDHSTYTEFIEEICTLLENKGEETAKKLESEMKAAAQSLNFEKAARLRDGLRALSVLKNQNIVESFDGSDRDYIASWREGELVSFTVLRIRSGKLLGRDNYRTITLNEDTEILGEFMASYYSSKEDIPPSIYVVTEDGMEIMKRWFSETYKIECQIIVAKPTIPQAKLHLAAIQMAQENAREDIIRRVRERGDFPAMEELQKVLGLPRLPVRIEGFDSPHWRKIPRGIANQLLQRQPGQKKLPLLPPKDNRRLHRRLPVNEGSNIKALHKAHKRKAAPARPAPDRRWHWTG